MWEKQARHATQLFFPPFTPKEILENYMANAVQVPFIVRNAHVPAVDKRDSQRKHILLIDSGSGVLYDTVEIVIDNLTSDPQFQFFVTQSHNRVADNITVLRSDQLIVDVIPGMDLVIARGGYNTISECLYCRTPMLLISEDMNPEMDYNLMKMKKENLASFISVEKLRNDPIRVINSFFDGEFEQIKKSMDEHEFRFDGAKIIAEHILNGC